MLVKRQENNLIPENEICLNDFPSILLSSGTNVYSKENKNTFHFQAGADQGFLERGFICLKVCVCVWGGGGGGGSLC